MMSTEDSYLEDKLMVGYNRPASRKKKKKQSLLSTLVTAVGNFSVQYNFQAISIALLVMASSVCTTGDDECKEGEQAEWVSSTATATVFVGAITGQLTMGYAGDLFGRNHAMTLTLGLVTFAAILSAVAPHGSPNSVYATIIVMRFILGIGVGGIYPLSATKAAEDGGGGKDGGIDLNAASWAFFWQVPGSMTPWILALIFSYCDMSNDSRWRLLLGLGAVPAAFVVVCSVLETRAVQSQAKDNDFASHALLNPAHADQFHHHADGGIGHSSAHGGSSHSSSISSAQGPFHDSFGAGSLSGRVPEDKKAAESTHVRAYMRTPGFWMKMMVTGGGWFIYDVAYYGVNLFGGQILSSIGSSDDDNVSSTEAIRNIAGKQVIALSMGIPACLCAIMALRVLGTKRLQVAGFFFIAVCFIAMAALFKPLSHGRLENTNALFAVYCILLFSLSWGPNLTTYVLPAQTYPKEVRATFNGVSAACGKLGAFTGVYVFGTMADLTSYATVMVFCAVISVFGAGVTEFGISAEHKREATMHGEGGTGDLDDDADSIVQ